MKIPGIDTPNPHINPLLTALKKPIVELWAIPLERYVQDGGVAASLSELPKVIDGRSQYKTFDALMGEFSPSHIFGSNVCFPIVRGGKALSVFVPDYMSSEEREQFWTSISNENISAIKLKAIKTTRKWMIENEE